MTRMMRMMKRMTKKEEKEANERWCRWIYGASIHRRYVPAKEGWMATSEMDFILDSALARKGMGVFLEVGSYKGRSASAFTLAGVTVCIDPFSPAGSPGTPAGNIDAAFIKNMKKVGRLNRVVVLRMPSSEALKVLEGTQVAVALIDGSHDYEDVKSDLHSVWKMVVKGGRMIIDDIYRPDIARAVKEELTDRGVVVHDIDHKIAFCDKQR